MIRSRITLVAIFILVGFAASHASVRVAPAPPTSGTNDFYVSNQLPLAPSRLVKLPIGAIKPEGWVRRQLELQADGFCGHLTEISRFLKKDGNAWLASDGQGHSPWEELPYWLMKQTWPFLPQLWLGDVSVFYALMLILHGCLWEIQDLWP